VKKQLKQALIFGVILNLTTLTAELSAKVSSARIGYDITATGLVPQYPTGYDCSPLTSLYASWIDVDGTRRDRPHSGVDGGRLGDPILAPANGEVIAVWKANWGWGEEGALLIRHTREDLGLDSGAPFYYSEFDHLKFEEIKQLAPGTRITRGQRLATVTTPGGKDIYLPEVHWEVWEVTDDRTTTWRQNRFNGRTWTNTTRRLIDPLYLLSLQSPPDDDGTVVIPIYDPGRDYSGFRGFTYILPCTKLP
jgi:murein DD-endopeptidase MepM/ murein hydrolase activator NlpD